MQFQFAAEYVKRNLPVGLCAKIRVLKVLTASSLDAKAKLVAVNKMRGRRVTMKMLNLLSFTEEEYKQIWWVSYKYAFGPFTDVRNYFF